MRRIVWGLGIVFILLFLYDIFLFYHSEKRTLQIRKICEILPESVFFVITAIIFIPSSLFLSNSSEFSVGYINILPIVCIMALVSLVGIVLVAAAIKKDKIRNAYVTFIFSIALGFYLQSNFLNPKLPELNGAQIEWSRFRVSGIISILVWLLCVIGFQIVVNIWTKHVVKMMKYASFFLTAVMSVTLITLIITTPKPNASDISLSKEDEFSIGTAHNVIVFVLDSMGADKFSEILSQNRELQSNLTNFTFFDNVVSGGAYTSVGIPTLLTGSEFDPTWQGYSTYLNQAWKDVSLYKDLKQKNYDIRLFTDSRYVTNVSSELISNVESIGEGYQITNKLKFSKALYQLSCFYAMPQILKPIFWMNGDDLTSLIEPVSSNRGDTNNEGDDLSTESSGNQYSFNDELFYQELKANNGVKKKFQNAYRVYHLNGAHAPYTLSKDGVTLSSGESSEEEQILGCMKIVDDYIASLKEQGLYDKSMIVITADHGRAGHESGIQQNPCVLVKMPHEEHALQINSEPLHVRNVMATIAMSVCDDYSSYGPSLYDIDQNSDVERLHTVASPVCVDWFPQVSEDRSFARFIIPYDVMDNENIIYYDPEEINRFHYTIGDTISFNNNSQNEIQYRAYKEDEICTFSNEFTMYMDLDGYNGDDLWLKFKCAKVYNHSQKMRIYIKGERIGEITCTSEDVGKEISVFIPKDVVKDNALPVRIVFPNAVTPKQIGESNDTRVLSIAISSMKIE